MSGGITGPELHYVCVAEALMVEGKAQKSQGGSLPEGSSHQGSLPKGSCPDLDNDIVGPASGVAWPAPRQFTMADLKGLNVLVVGDSGLFGYDKSGSRYDLEIMFHDVGWKNLLWEARAGEGPPQWAQLLRAYVEVHKEYLVRDGAGGLQLPPEFILLVYDNQNNLHWNDGACCVRSVDDVPAAYVEEYALFLEMMSYWQAPGLVTGIGSRSH